MMMSAPSGEGGLHAHGREWTGSVSDLPKSLRALAQEFLAKANAHPDSPLASYVQDHAWTLTEWADAVELLYARLDTEGEVPTNAQGIALARFLRGHWTNVENRFRFASVSRGGAGLSDDYLYVRMGDGYEGGIDRAGRTST
jgi:hypothetical protein